METDTDDTEVKLLPWTTPNRTVVPAAGAGTFRVTVPVVEAGARSGPGGEKVTERMVTAAGGDVTVTVARWMGLSGNGVDAEIVELIDGMPSAMPDAVNVNEPVVWPAAMEIEAGTWRFCKVD